MPPVLILTANPFDTEKIRWEKEINAARDALRHTKFQIISVPQAEISRLQTEFHACKPRIVHFVGHGETDGLIFNDADGYARQVPAQALADLFRLFKNQVQCVLLNACWSEEQAQAIHAHIPVVIGMEKAVQDEAALSFAAGFYTALSENKNYREAFEFGRNAMHLHGGDQHTIPVLLYREPPAKKWRALGAASLVAALILSFAAWWLLPPPAQVLAGAVRDSNGEPLAGVEISLPAYGVSTLTNHNGRFRLEIRAPRQAEVELLAQKDGYQVYEQYATLGNMSLGFSLREK